MRREIIVSGTVKAAAALAKGVAVNAAGAVVTSGVPFGFTLDPADAGVYVAVVRLGFAPVVRSGVAGGAFGDGIAVTTSGFATTATTANRVVGTLQGASSATDGFAPAWVNCLDVNIF